MQLAMKFAILAAIAQAMFAAASPVYSEEDTNLPERRELSKRYTVGIMNDMVNEAGAYRCTIGARMPGRMFNGRPPMGDSGMAAVCRPMRVWLANAATNPS